MQRLYADGRVAAAVGVQLGAADGGLRIGGHIAGHEDGLIATLG